MPYREFSPRFSIRSNGCRMRRLDRFQTKLVSLGNIGACNPASVVA
jgi:hypothetical protein